MPARSAAAGGGFQEAEVRRNAERLAHGLATALPEDVDSARLTLTTVGDVRDGAYVVGALADELARESMSVAVVDLSASGVLAQPSRRLLGRPDPIHNRQLVRVHRHDVRVSELASRTRVRVSSDKDLAKAEVILTLIELDLGAGVDMLGDLADACVVLVRAGRVSAERLRSSATLLRQSDLHPAFAMLVGADDTDDSSGLLGRRPAKGSSRRGGRHDSDQGRKSRRCCPAQPPRAGDRRTRGWHSSGVRSSSMSWHSPTRRRCCRSRAESASCSRRGRWPSRWVWP